MNRSELTEAYVSGRISRRSFVRGMVVLGASVPVAMALADRVSATPTVNKGWRYSDIYPDPYPEFAQSTSSSSDDPEDVNLATSAAAALMALRRDRYDILPKTTTSIDIEQRRQDRDQRLRNDKPGYIRGRLELRGDIQATLAQYNPTN